MYRSIVSGLILIYAVALGLPSSAQSPESGLAERVAAFSQSVRDGDVGAMFDVLPPRLLPAIAARHDTDPAMLRLVAAEMMRQLASSVVIEEATFDVASANHLKTVIGQRDYLLIPTRTVILVEGRGRALTESRTLAFQDDGQWWLVRIDNAEHVAVLKAEYPEFGGVEFPASKTTMLE